MMKNELAYRNRKGTTLWSPLSVAVCKDEKYRFLDILWGKVCVFKCNILLSFVGKPRAVPACRAKGILSAFFRKRAFTYIL